MAVPNTNTFKLSDVITFIDIFGVDSLADCFTVADAGLFDVAYQGSKDRLSNFRNYGNPIILSATEGYFDFEGILLSGVETFNVISSPAWTSECTGAGSVDPTSGASGTTGVTAYPGYNGSGNPRVSTADFIYGGTVYATFTMYQEG